MSDSRSMRPAKLRDGRPYTGIQDFKGSGTNRSCGKCGTFRPVGDFKKLAPWGLACKTCRGVE
jgi:hypothetical protein